MSPVAPTPATAACRPLRDVRAPVIEGHIGLIDIRQDEIRDEQGEPPDRVQNEKIFWRPP